MRPEILEKVFLYYVQKKTSRDAIDSPKPEAVSLHDKFPLQTLENFSDQIIIPGQSSPPVIEHEQLNAEQTVKVIDFGKKLIQMTEEFSMKRPEGSPISFESCWLLVPVKQQTIRITINRQKTSQNLPLRVRWNTHDRTAKSGTHYISSSGEFVLEADKNKHHIEVQTLQFETDAQSLRFEVHLSVENSVYDPKSLTISFKDMAKLESDEKNVIECLTSLTPESIPGIYRVLKENLNARTFHSALSYLCSKVDHLPLEFALALELSRLCLPDIPYKNVLDVLSDFFRCDDIDL